MQQSCQQPIFVYWLQFLWTVVFSQQLSKHIQTWSMFEHAGPGLCHLCACDFLILYVFRKSRSISGRPKQKSVGIQCIPLEVPVSGHLPIHSPLSYCHFCWPISLLWAIIVIEAVNFPCPFWYLPPWRSLKLSSWFLLLLLVGLS